MVEQNRIDIALIFDIKKLDDELEYLTPIKAVAGIHNDKTNTFRDLEDDVIYDHITKAMVNVKGYGMRLSIPLPKEDTEEFLKDAENRVLEMQSTYKYYRYAEIPEKVYISEPGQGWMLLVDEDCPQERKKPKVGKPKEIVEEVIKSVKGQDEAVKTIATYLWQTLTFPNMKKKNMLVLGPTGVGKTMIFEEMQKVLGYPLVIFNIPGLSQAGYQGRSTEEILKQIYFDCGCDEELASQAVVVLDEIDKIAFTPGMSGDVSTEGVQNELLKIIEGEERDVELNPSTGETFHIDTHGILFVATGAFSEIFEATQKKHPIGFVTPEDKTKKEDVSNDTIKNYGLKRELIGRLPNHVTLGPMTKLIIIDILKSDRSELKAHIDALESMGITVVNIEELYDIIADDALASKIGARGLVKTVSEAFVKIFYEVGNNPKKYEKLIIGKNILKDNSDFTLVPKQVKRRVRTVKKNW